VIGLALNLLLGGRLLHLLVCDVTVVSRLGETYFLRVAIGISMVAKMAAEQKAEKYYSLSS